MPLEISEIGVHIAVGGDPASPASGAGAAPAEPATPPLTQSRISALVSACVQKVLTTLRLRESR